jgi:hypothetical protein
MLIDDIKMKWIKERETLGYVKLEYGRLIDLFVSDLSDLKKEFDKYEKMEEVIKHYKEGNYE